MLADKVLVFDLDGTLYPASAEIERQVDDRVAEFLTFKMNLTLNEARQLVENIRSRYYYDADALNDDFPFSKREFMDYICDVDVSQLSRNEKLAGLLAQVSQPKFILTDSTSGHVKSVLRTVGIPEGIFAGIFDSHDMNYVFKYKPESFESFLHKYNLKAENCILFEDSFVNIKVAKSLGFATILIDKTASLDLPEADLRFTCAADALECLLK